jgi:hypothetical protein
VGIADRLAALIADPREPRRVRHSVAAILVGIGDHHALMMPSRAPMNQDEFRAYWASAPPL